MNNKNIKIEPESLGWKFISTGEAKKVVEAFSKLEIIAGIFIFSGAADIILLKSSLN